MADYILGTLPNFLYPGPTCAVIGDLPNFTGEIAGDQHLNILSGAMPNFTGAIVANTGRFGILSGALPNFTGSIAADTGRAIALSGSLPNFTGSIIAVPHKIAAISGTLPNFTGNIAAHFICNGQILGTLPNFSGSIISLGTFSIVVVNPTLRGVTEYTNYDFNSIIELGGQLYGFGAAGVYLLTGLTDNGTPISAYFDSGDTEYAKGQKSKILDAHLLGRTSGTLNLTLTADDGTSYTYGSIGDATGTLQNHRFKPGKGVEGIRHRYRVANVTGSTLEAQELRLLIGESARKR